MDFHVAKAIVNVTFITAKPTPVEHLAAVRRAEAFFFCLWWWLSSVDKELAPGPQWLFRNGWALHNCSTVLVVKMLVQFFEGIIWLRSSHKQLQENGWYGIFWFIYSIPYNVMVETRMGGSDLDGLCTVWSVFGCQNQSLQLWLCCASKICLYFKIWKKRALKAEHKADNSTTGVLSPFSGLLSHTLLWMWEESVGRKGAMK